MNIEEAAQLAQAMEGPFSILQLPEMEIGAERSGDHSTCGHNPTIPLGREDPAADCGLPARWHVMVKGLVLGQPYETQLMACDAHQGRAIGTGQLVSMHEVGSACGLEGTWWVNVGQGAGSLCVTEETGLELGYLVVKEPVG